MSQLIRINDSRAFFFTPYTFLLFVIILLALLGILVYYYLKEVNRRAALELKSSDTGLALQNLLDEREWLLKEINHRVKNNLQIMISLLNSQEFFLKDKVALGAVKNSQRRLHAISLAYQKVYDLYKPAQIDMHIYITELVEYLQDEYSMDANVICNLHVCKTYLPISAAVPIGLIINEALSNCFKYAFPTTFGGKIEIDFICTSEDGCYRLSISDNGIGLPEKFEVEEIRSLGTSLMLGLSKQLRGELSLKNENGVLISVDFTNLTSENEYQI